ncbi:MAG: GNAT family N-acetyltransferase [Clostridiaceae bacterium]|nr:GNAT family N-acetyltransferase [Clostridiaceae bacterium]
MEYRKLKYDEINAFVETRIEFVTLIRDIDNIELFKDKTREYIKTHLDSDDLLIYVAIDGGNIASTCMLSIYETPPLPSNVSGRQGELLNVYTKKEYRRKGHSAKLIKLLVSEAKNMGVSKIVLEYTKEGYPLYKSLGFSKVDNYMEYRS